MKINNFQGELQKMELVGFGGDRRSNDAAVQVQAPLEVEECEAGLQDGREYKWVPGIARGGCHDGILVIEVTDEIGE